ncbi:MAG: aminopeptidase P family protein [Lachnospiraceae bacterium]|nr:aminopeptidase P family protein [Lachnospiraceae bacterium]MDY4097958.1 aminopeptidase P family protein [Lachnospiraceae bacterium]
MESKERITALRSLMKENHIDYYFITTSDYHNSEYVDDYFKAREYMSGFTGSNGDLLIGANFAGLWTDGRYFIQAERELEGSGILLFRMGEEGVCGITEYLTEHIEQGQTLAFDGRCVSIQMGKRLEKAVEKKEAHILYEVDYIERLWKNRPSRRASQAFLLPHELCGKNQKEKLELVRTKMEKLDCSSLVLNKLDDIMWLFNLRGGDVECNPVALAYSIITQKDCFLFLQKAALTDKVKEELAASSVVLKDYDRFNEELEQIPWEGRVLLDKENSNYSIYKLVKKKAEVVLGTNPTQKLKAIKNEVELEQMKRVYLLDSLVVCRFMRWLKENVGKIPMTELSAARYMDQLRRDTEGFLDLSFPTICAYRENAAMMHYQATTKQDKEIQAEGMLLIDSGGQYMGGTTDVTRTYCLGEVTAEMKDHYTAVVVGMLRLLNGKFLYGCTGRNLDILARGPLWDMGIDYKCGTGHGIGYILNVHEGPQNIRWRFSEGMEEVILEEGMVLSNEPGVYKAGSHGIRIENIMAVKKGIKNEDGQFMEFEGLTYAPIDLQLINPDIMEKRDILNLNRYHRQVYERIAPLMTEEEKNWLQEVTKEI